MEKTIKGCSLVLAFCALTLTGCARVSSSSEVGRNYDFDALQAYLSDSGPSVKPVVYQADGEPQSQTNAPIKYESFYGRWVAKMDLKEEMAKAKAEQPADPNADPEATKMGEEFAEAMAAAFAEMMTFQLDIEKDGTFKFAMMGMPMEGKWTQKGQALHLVPEKFLGLSADEFSKQSGKPKPESKPLILQISPDGKSLIGRDPEGIDPQVLEFKRE